MGDLNRCPFCGGEANADGRITYSENHEAWWPDGAQVLEAFFVNCMTCSIDNKGMIGHRTRADAIAAWNRRALSAPAVTREEDSSARDHAPETCAAQGTTASPTERLLNPDYWEVEVRIEGQTVLTIGHSHLAGVSEPELDHYADRIRACAEHLTAFIGPPEPAPCFACGGSGQERWMGETGEEVGPCSVCAAPADDVSRDPTSTTDGDAAPGTNP